MTDRKNIKLPEPLFNALRDDKSDHMSWPVYFETECLYDDEDADVADRLDDIEALAREATQAAQAAERAVEELQR